ncbi:MAG: nitroreductase family protein [Actinomycetota bacterium]|nr:nitroreductase family protein [Actinomycetota bacterium]
MSNSFSESGFDLAQVDRLLTTTRAVRKRLDFEREVTDELIFECIDLAEQAPTGGNDASRRWLVIRDQSLKDQLGELYAEVGTLFINARGRLEGTGHPKEQVVNSSAYLVENFAKAPVLVMCAIWGLHDNSGRPGLFDSAIPSAWSFNLALRSRGLGTAYATMLNNKSDEVADLLGIPPGVTTLVCFPVAYTLGGDFSPVSRRPASNITYFDQWGFTRERPSADGSARVQDGPGVVVEIDTDARPKAVWEHISDINMPAQFSNEFVGADWVTSGAIGPGSVFKGRNSIANVRDWETDCIVTEWIERQVFEWRITDPVKPGAIWRFEVAEQGAGSRLRFSMVIGKENNGTAPRALQDPSLENDVLFERRLIHKANMQRVVEGVKSLVDGPVNGDRQ